MGKLYNELIDYSDSNVYPFHMPGHKRNIEKVKMDNPYKIDITEIEGFDDLHHSEGMLKELMDNAAINYGTKKTYFLINGSTCGILSAIAATVKSGEKILMARNCHKSVYHAVFLGKLAALYVYPKNIINYNINGGIDFKDIEICLSQNSDIKAVVITSPTYEGVVLDVKKISQIVHQYNIPLIVDEAHGAHFGMHKELPMSAIHLGADIVIQSLHKTLPSLTQTALLHVIGDRISVERLEMYLGIYQSSSPSYVLLASIDSCLSYLNIEGKKLFEEFIEILIKYRTLIKGLKNIKIVEDIKDKYFVNDYDISKIVLSVKRTNYTGKQLYDELLNKYHIQVEMASTDYIIAITSCLDKEIGLQRLYKALVEIDNRIKYNEITEYAKDTNIIKLITKYSIAEAMDLDTLVERFDQAGDKVSAEYMYLYPPGIPIIVPGEIITEELINIVKDYANMGFSVKGLESKSVEYIKIIMNK